MLDFHTSGIRVAGNIFATLFVDSTAVRSLSVAHHIVRCLHHIQFHQPNICESIACEFRRLNRPSRRFAQFVVHHKNGTFREVRMRWDFPTPRYGQVVEVVVV